MTNMQRVIYDFIIKYTKQHFIPPTYEEIGEAVGLKSKSTIYTHMSKLMIKGYIIKHGAKRYMLKPEVMKTIFCDINCKKPLAVEQEKEISDFTAMLDEIQEEKFIEIMSDHVQFFSQYGSNLFDHNEIEIGQVFIDNNNFEWVCEYDIRNSKKIMFCADLLLTEEVDHFFKTKCVERKKDAAE